MKTFYKITACVLVVAVLFGLGPLMHPAFADPTLPLSRMPICGDQDGSETPLILNCPNLSPNLNVQAYQVVGNGSIRFDFVFREASYNNELGYFKVDDSSFSINGLHPGDPGYLAAAFSRRNIIFQSGSDAFTSDVTFSFNSGNILVFFIIQDNSVANFLATNPGNDLNKLPLAFFSIDKLNPDSIDHFIGFQNSGAGLTQFGFEDLTGGGDRDYDDVVYNIGGTLAPVGVYDYKQYDSQWDDVSSTGVHTSPFLFLNNGQIISKDNPGCYTLKVGGCAISAFADVLATYGRKFPSSSSFGNLQIDPHTLNAFLATLYSGTCVVPWNTAGNPFGISERYTDSGKTPEEKKKAVHDALVNGQLPILEVASSTSPNGTHFVVAYQEVAGANNTVDYKIADPTGPVGSVVMFSEKSYMLRAVIVYNGGLPPGTTFVLRSHSPVQLLITDPSGNQTGYIASTSSFVEDIPLSAYDSEPGLTNDSGDLAFPRELSPTNYFELSNPSNGTYTLQVIGTGTGPYSLEFDNADATGATKEIIISGNTVLGKVDTYHFTIPSSATQPVNVQQVNEPPTLNILEQQNVQYRDSLSFDVSATDPNDSGNTLTFSVTGLPNDLTLTDNGDGTATVSGNANVAPGTYTAQITVTDPDGLSDTKPVNIVVTQEDARTTYTGPLMGSTGCATCSTAIIPLRATIQDITAVLGDPAYDPDPGNITNATVNFVDRSNNAVLCTANVNLLNADPTFGTATCNWIANIGSSYGVDYTIGTVVDGYYTRNSTEDDVVVVVSKPTSNFITGGGYFVNQKSGGTYAGDVGLKTNFGLNIKFTQKLTNLQGRVTIIVRQGEHVYQIKSTALNSLVAIPFSPSNAKSGTAELIGKATVTDVTNPLNSIAVAGNATLNIVMKDNGEPGSADLIGISLWSKDGKLLYSSTWDGKQTLKVMLNGGNLSIK